jgi:serine/threonine protein kinase
MSREDIRLFADLLRSMFKWKPEERASFEQVMRHPWLEGRIVPGVKRESKELLAELAGRFLGG